jgi:hypothetical protein
MINAVIEFLNDWQPVVYTLSACAGLGVAVRRLELARIDKDAKEAEKLSEFKKAVYAKMAALELSTSTNRQDIALVDDYSKKVRLRVIALDALTTDCIKTSSEAIAIAETTAKIKNLESA